MAPVLTLFPLTALTLATLSGCVLISDEDRLLAADTGAGEAPGRDAGAGGGEDTGEVTGDTAADTGEGPDDDEASDRDSDGLADVEEARLGTDPDDPDSDDDALVDGAEVALGTDPLDADSDDDTYRDGDEAFEGTDPLDAASRIYVGYWPYYRDKEALFDPGWSEGGVREGGRMWRLEAPDQFGDVVDVFDLAGHGRPVVFTLCAAWSEACDDLASLLEGGAAPSYDDFLDEPWYALLPALVAEGQITWVTILDYETEEQIATEATAADWYARHPNPAIPVLVDLEGSSVADCAQAVGYPTVWLVEEDMRISVYDPVQYDEVFNALVDRFGG